MHTPNKVGNAFYINNDSAWQNFSSASPTTSSTNPKPYVPSAWQSGQDFQCLNMKIGLSTASLSNLHHISFAMKMSDIEEEVGDQPFGIEISGCANLNNDEFDIKPFVLFASSVAYTSDWMTTVNDPHWFRLPVITQHCGNTLTHASWDTKAVIAENDNPSYECFVGVIITNNLGASAGTISGNLSISARYDFSSVETYYRGR